MMFRAYNTIILYFLHAFAFITLAQALNARDLAIAEIPACGLQCLVLSIPKSKLKCGFTDIACICADNDLGQSVSTCMVANCTMAENLGTARVNKKMCNLSTESQTATVVTYTTAVYVVALTFVCLRVAGRLAASRFSWNDAPIIAAILLAAIPIGVVFAMSSLGFGEHLWNLEDDRLLPILRYFYIAWSAYVAILGLIKISLILFFLEIFTTRQFRIVGWIVLAYIVVNSTVILLVTIFACTPVQAFWDRDLTLGKGKCMDIQAIGYANSISAIVQDIILLVLPMFFVKNLYMKRYRKLAVGVMFAIGSFGCIATIVRLRTLLAFKISFDPTWDYVPIVIWTELEITACFICVSIPPIRVLVMRSVPPSVKDWFTKSLSASNDKSKTGPDPRHDLSLPQESWRKPTAWVMMKSNEDLEHANWMKEHDTPAIDTPRSVAIPLSKFSSRTQDLHSPVNKNEKGKTVAMQTIKMAR